VAGVELSFELPSKAGVPRVGSRARVLLDPLQNVQVVGEGGPHSV
jgi:hypothetical protein